MIQAAEVLEGTGPKEALHRLLETLLAIRLRRAPAGFVAIPYWGSGVHHHIELLFILGKGRENANTEYEAVEDDVHQDAEADDGEPGDGQPVIESMSAFLREIDQRPR